MEEVLCCREEYSSCVPVLPSSIGDGDWVDENAFDVVTEIWRHFFWSGVVVWLGRDAFRVRSPIIQTSPCPDERHMFIQQQATTRTGNESLLCQQIMRKRLNQEL